MFKDLPHGETQSDQLCPNAAHMGEHACTNRHQCWEPCGELGHGETHVRVFDENGNPEPWIATEPKTLREGEPCDHPGCLSHVSHPCEGCGRIAGKQEEQRT